MLWTTKSESDKTYWDYNGNLFNFLKCSLQQSLFLIPIMIIRVFFFKPKNILTIIRVSPKYYSIHHNREVGIIYHFQWFLGQKSLNCSNQKTCRTQFWNRIYMGLPSECIAQWYSKKYCITNISYFLVFMSNI